MTRDEFAIKEESKSLLKECLDFMNKVPNNKYGNNYELCSRIEKFLKQLNSD